MKVCRIDVAKLEWSNCLQRLGVSDARCTTAATALVQRQSVVQKVMCAGLRTTERFKSVTNATGQLS
jgi:hypothetical protein